MDKAIRKIVVSGGLLLVSVFFWHVYAQDNPVIKVNNLVVNGGFEKWETSGGSGDLKSIPQLSDGLPAQWIATVSAYERASDPDFEVKGKVFKDAEIKHGDNYSVRIENGLTTDITEVLQGQFKVESNTSYLIRCWVRGENIVPNSKDGAGVVVWANFGPLKDYGPNQVSFPKSPEKASGTFDWQLLEINVNTDSTAGLMCILLQLRRASGKVWYDDVEVIPVGEVKAVESF